MDPGQSISESSGPAPSSRMDAGITVIIQDRSWHRLMRDPERVVRRAAAVTGCQATFLLTNDTDVKRLNFTHRGRNKATNVLTFESGEIALASGVVAREAAREGKRPADHLAHLVVHGALHLQGHDHARAGDAIRMEMIETRLLGRIGVPNPWSKSWGK